MFKAIKLIALLSLLVILLIPSTISDAAASGPRISHVCVADGETVTTALVVWPGAPYIPSGAKGSLTIQSGDQTFDVPLSYVGTFGTTAKFSGTLPSGYSGTMVIISGWVLDKSNTVQNLPYSFEYGKPCTPTAVVVQSMSAASQPSRATPLAWGALALAAMGLIVIKRH